MKTYHVTAEVVFASGRRRNQLGRLHNKKDLAHALRDAALIHELGVALALGSSVIIQITEAEDEPRRMD